MTTTMAQAAGTVERDARDAAARLDRVRARAVRRLWLRERRGTVTRAAAVAVLVVAAVLAAVAGT